MSLDQCNKVLSVNLTGQLLCAREAIREFRRRGIVPSVSCFDYVVGTTLFIDGGMTLYLGFATNG
jgi:hypothetical protein